MYHLFLNGPIVVEPEVKTGIGIILLNLAGPIFKLIIAILIILVCYKFFNYIKRKQEIDEKIVALLNEIKDILAKNQK
jgi:hypothetical protein